MVTNLPNPLSLVLISLLKGVTEREADQTLWQTLLAQQNRVRDHVAVLGLELILDEAEGYAYLRQRPAQEGEAELPRLIARRQLGYHVSLLLALLRKKLIEFDATSGETRLILSREELIEMMRLFLPDATNQVRLVERVDASINRIIELGFLRKLRGTNGQFEVRRILKAFVDGQWLAELDARLKTYRIHADSGEVEAKSNDAA
ncbi:DUF4194 domain-containing protein [Bradyrhizobium sp. Arg68]|uniref:DUF4194 domain-containing protein n=1 Tax=Bradyrhizobium ivorense TaxID=2511166 RepID=UPI001E37FA80|nr:DUF4194 domain-containing protein [Bradyrhizobium ivorense]MCC8936028.1 DUF4194 domain-containing protein [Bradyrhizobium ivorense]